MIYAKTINFDVSNDGLSTIDEFRVLKFLYSWIYAPWTKTCYGIVNKHAI